MPSIMSQNEAADQANVLQGNKFEEIPPGGAILTLYASTPVTTGAVSLDVEGGGRSVLDSAEVNIEASADVVDVDRDLVLDREPVGEGKLFLATEAQVINFLLVIEYV